MEVFGRNRRAYRASGQRCLLQGPVSSETWTDERRSGLTKDTDLQVLELLTQGFVRMSLITSREVERLDLYIDIMLRSWTEELTG